MPRILPVSEDERRAICSVAVTLDDQPATISGVEDAFATITDAHGNSVQYGWTIVATIVVREGGKFLS
jgi:hypothetical protein